MDDLVRNSNDYRSSNLICMVGPCTRTESPTDFSENLCGHKGVAHLDQIASPWDHAQYIKLSMCVSAGSNDAVFVFSL